VCEFGGYRISQLEVLIILTKLSSLKNITTRYQSILAFLVM